jgi:predicted kinase
VSRPPRCVLMAGLPGSGKTTLSRSFVAQGFARLCPDEEMWRRYGVYGVDFPRGEFRVREAPVLEDVFAELRSLLSTDQDVVVDHGFWTPSERSTWREAAVDAGAVPTLVYLPVPHDELWSRIKRRNEHSHADANSISFSESDLQRFAGRFFPPTDEEPHLVYDGDAQAVVNSVLSSGYEVTRGA